MVCVHTRTHTLCLWLLGRGGYVEGYSSLSVPRPSLSFVPSHSDRAKAPRLAISQITTEGIHRCISMVLDRPPRLRLSERRSSKSGLCLARATSLCSRHSMHVGKAAVRSRTNHHCPSLQILNELAVHGSCSTSIALQRCSCVTTEYHTSMVILYYITP